MSLGTYADLTLATTIHNNLERWLQMATSFEREVGRAAEIVVVDDGSSIPAKVAGLRSPVRLLRNDPARGFCRASDQALREVQTPFALLLDADITFLPGDFHAAFEAFKAHPQLAWSNFQQVSAEGHPGGSTEEIIPPAWVYALGNQVTDRWRRRRMRTWKPEKLDSRVIAVPIAHSSSALVRMKAFREIGGFDFRFWQCQSDNDICMRLGAAGWKVGADQVYRVRHDGIGGKTGGANRVYDLYRGKLLFYERHRPACRLYLRPLLSLRHLLETFVALLRGRSREEHLRPSFRLRLALGALRGYPAERR
jgi:N-acetylglucosaminyl-diphospho-decaprenol L-rhamnosyltransferase